MRNTALGERESSLFEFATGRPLIKICEEEPKLHPVGKDALNQDPLFVRQLFKEEAEFEAKRKELYKDLVSDFNKEIEKGPMKGLIIILGVTREPHTLGTKLSHKFKYGGKRTFAFENRLNAYQSYIKELTQKYANKVADLKFNSTC
jgi:hypothetical protein